MEKFIIKVTKNTQARYVCKHKDGEVLQYSNSYQSGTKEFEYQKQAERVAEQIMAIDLHCSAIVIKV